MNQNMYPFLMFQGQAADAMAFYVSLFGVRVLCTDSPVTHTFHMNPAVSLFVVCDNEAELERFFAALAEGGDVRMALDNYGFSRRFGWTDDRFGVS